MENSLNFNNGDVYSYRIPPRHSDLTTFVKMPRVMIESKRLPLSQRILLLLQRINVD
ncbi:MAG: hypothetical protein PVH04_02260 [Gammaproteobacteria bacterium]